MTSRASVRAFIGALVLEGVGCALLAGVPDGELRQGTGGQGGASEKVAEGQAGPKAILVDTANVYWTTEAPGQRAIWRAAISGGPPQKLADIPDIAWSAGLVDKELQSRIGIAEQGELVYWTQNNVAGLDGGSRDEVMSVSKDGGTPTLVWSADSGEDLYGIAADGQYIFFDQDGYVKRIDKAVGHPFAITPGKWRSFYPLVIDSNNVLWLHKQDAPKTQTAVVAVEILMTSKYVEAPPPTDAGLPEPTKIHYFPPVDAGGSVARFPVALAVDEASVYWVDSGYVRKADKQKDAAAVDLHAGNGALTAIAVDSANQGYVYWANVTEGAIYRVSKQGGSPEQIAKDQSYPAGIAVDADAVYWTNFTSGEIIRRLKSTLPH